MEKTVRAFKQVVLLLVLTAVPLACIAASTAPLHSPGLAEEFSCPPGAQLRSEWYQASWNRPGEKTLAVSCVDAQGNELPMLPQDTKWWLSGLATYFPYFAIPLLAIFAFGKLWTSLRRSK